MDDVIRQNVSFRTTDYEIASGLASKKGVDFSAAVRIIIREWDEYNEREHARRYSQTNTSAAVVEAEPNNVASLKQG